jgi:hypothetical protein
MPESTTVSVDDMRACLGSLLFLWADIERELREQVARQRGTVPSPAHGIAVCLRSWRSSIPDTNNIGQFRGELADSLIQQLQHALTIRNGLCHGLTGYSSGSERSAQLLWRLNGHEGRVSYKELQDSFKWLARIPRAFSCCPAHRSTAGLTDALTQPQTGYGGKRSLPSGFQPDRMRSIGQ